MIQHTSRPAPSSAPPTMIRTVPHVNKMVYPKRSKRMIVVQECSTPICAGCIPAATFLSVLLYWYEYPWDSRGDKEDATSFTMTRTQQEIEEYACHLIDRKTVHDTAIPLLILFGYLTVIERVTGNCYILHLDRIRAAYAAYGQSDEALHTYLLSRLELEPTLIDTPTEELEKILLNKKRLYCQLESMLIAIRSGSNCRRGPKVGHKRVKGTSAETLEIIRDSERDSLSARADAGQSSQQNDEPSPSSITSPTISYSQDTTTHTDTPTVSTLPPGLPEGVISISPSQPTVPSLTEPMTTGNAPVEPVEIPPVAAHVTLHPTSSLRLSARGVEEKATTDEPPAVPPVQEPEPDIPIVYDRHVKIADCPPDIQARRRHWQQHFNLRRGNEPLDQQGPRIEEAKAIADLVAKYTDAQIRAIDTHVLASFPYNQPGRQFEVSGSVVMARAQTARQALKERRKWPTSPGEIEPVVPIAPVVAAVHHSRYIPSHLLT